MKMINHKQYIQDRVGAHGNDESWISLGDNRSLNKAGLEKVTKLHNRLRPTFRAVEGLYKDKHLTVSFFGYWVKGDSVFIRIRFHSVLEYAFYDYEIDLDSDNIEPISETILPRSTHFVEEAIDPLFETYPYLKTLLHPFSVNIIGADGKPLASNLLVVLDKHMFSHRYGDARALPVGTCSFGYLTDSAFNDLYLNLDDFICEYESRDASGCCGPAGSEWNIVSPDGIPLGIEFSDCWGPHCVTVQEGHYQIVFNREDTSVVLGEVFESQSQSVVLAVASGGDYAQAHQRLSLMVDDCLEEDEYQTDWFKAATRKTVQYRPHSPDSDNFWFDHWILNKYQK